MSEESNTSINFISEKDNRRSSKSKIFEVFIDWASHTGKHILVVIETIVLLSLALDFYLKRNITVTNNAISDLNLVVNQRDNQEIVVKHKQIQKDLITIEDIVSQQIDWQTNLQDLAEYIPEDMQTDRIFYQKDKVTISGKVNSPQGFGAFIQNLVNDEKVSSIVLNRSVFNIEEKTFTFDLDISIKT